MKLKQLIAALVLCATIATLALPASAASSFRDVTDPETAVCADILRLTGVVNGVGNNEFQPGSPLTRAQFCVMVINLMGRKDEVANHLTRTIFSDVTAKHWARGYVNLAATTTIKDTRLISGVGNGEFKPDSNITYAQAVTILLRVLGYGDDIAGSLWPNSYLNLADSLGLSEGLGNPGANTAITRAQASRLFANMLTTPTSDGSHYYATLGTVTDNVILLALNVPADDKTEGAIRTSAGTYLPANRGVVPTALLGRRGSLVLNAKQEIVTFIPDETTSLTIKLSGSAQPTYLVASDNTRYSVDPSTPVYTGEGTSTYKDIWMDLRPTSSVTLYSDSGKIIGMACAISRESSDAVIIQGRATEETFYQLTGGARNCTLLKDGSPISYGDLQNYDVVTYDSAANTLLVSSLRLNCYYESAAPNPGTPATIHTLGADLGVLECAHESISAHKVGQRVVLLLTADGKVAAMYDPGSVPRSTVIGIASAAGVEIPLAGGGTLKLSGKDAPAMELRGRLVTVASNGINDLAVNRFSSGSAPGSFDAKAMTLGDYPVAPGVRLYEQVSDSPLLELSLTALDGQCFPKEKISAYHLNSAGMVDLLVLNDFTGDCYSYGFLQKGTHSYSSYGFSGTNTTISVVNSGSHGPWITGLPFEEEQFGGAVPGSQTLNGLYKAAAIVSLAPYKSVRRSDFFQVKGVWYVNAQGFVFEVSSALECYNTTTAQWSTEEDKLSAIRTYSNNMTVYVDPIGNKVRIITTA